jgi:hypothetical protein
MSRRDIYKPMIQRSLENYQVSYLASKYDFSKQSLIARILVDEINKQIQSAEEIIGIKRVKPFHLYIRNNGKDMALALFSDSYLSPLFEGHNFRMAKHRVIKACKKIYRETIPGADPDEIIDFIDPLSKIIRKGQGPYQAMLQDSFSPYDEKKSRQIRERISKIDPPSLSSRMRAFDLYAPQDTIESLVDFIKEEIGFGKAIAKQMVEDVITLRNIACPRTRELKSGQMPMLITHVSARLCLETETRFRKLAPVVITVICPKQMQACQYNTAEYLEILKWRIARVAFEAYKQNGLLTLQEMQWVFLIDSTTIGKLLKSFQLEHNIIIPSPGTILDAGRSITHKDIIVRLHLQGRTVKEIARITYHSPRAVDNYIGTFEAVLILYLYKMRPELMSRILTRSITLIREYLKLIDELYKDVSEIKQYLIQKGVSF